MSSSSTNRAAAEEMVGYRFNPKDEQLLSHFLKNKMQGKASRFPEIPCCKHEPWDLRALLVPTQKTQEMEWYFFSRRDYKYAKSKRSNRATVQGYWKITGTPLKIKDQHSQAVIGYKRILTFYEGRGANSSKTNYIMHEYELAETELGSMPRQNGVFVLCRLKIKPDKSHKKKGSSKSDEADPDSYQAAADDMITDDSIPEVRMSMLNDSYIASEFENKAAADHMIAELEDLNDISDFEALRKQLFPQQGENQESLIHPTQPHPQQDYCFSTLQSPKEAKRGNIPHADVNNGECSWGQSPLGNDDSCLTNKNNISTNDNHEPVSNTASYFGSATDDSIREVVNQPGENLEPLFDPLLQESPLLSPMHTEPRDVMHGNNYIAGMELQTQFGGYLQPTPSPSNKCVKPDKFHKKKGSSICDEADPDSYIASHFENQAAEQEENLAFKELQDLLFPNGNVGECKDSQKDSCLIDENDISTCDGGAFSDFEMQQVFAQLEPQEQQDNCFATLQSPTKAKWGNVPHADVNNGECSWGQSPLGDNDSCLTNKNNISTNDNHEPVSNTASYFGSATDDSIPEVFTQPGENLEPLGYPILLRDYPLLSPMHTEPRDVMHGNNYIASMESQTQFGGYDFSLTEFDYYSYLQTTPSPSIDSNLPKSLGTQSPSNYSFQGNFALATGETLQCSQ